VRTLLTRYSDLVVAIVGMMIVPLPTPLLDLLISVNIATSVVLLLVAIYVSDALKIATFPTLLLLTTLFRLALEVSATRLILLRADAGEVIRAFGNFVVAGNLVVGAVVFLILTMIQFIVISKGSERVAEVAARFTLDAMPGKQMSIDAELRAGHIDHNEARRRRASLARGGRAAPGSGVSTARGTRARTRDGFSGLRRGPPDPRRRHPGRAEERRADDGVGAEDPVVRGVGGRNPCVAGRVRLAPYGVGVAMGEDAARSTIQPVAVVQRITRPPSPTAYIVPSRASMVPVVASAGVAVQVVPSKRTPSRASRNHAAPPSGEAATTSMTTAASKRTSGSVRTDDHVEPSKWARNPSADVAAPDGRLLPTAQMSLDALPDKP
jgi:FHIPEP family